MVCPIKSAVEKAMLDRRRRPKRVSKKVRNAEKRADLKAEKVLYPQPDKQVSAKRQSYKKKTGSRRKHLNNIRRLRKDYEAAIAVVHNAEDMENLNCMCISAEDEKCYRLLQNAFNSIDKKHVWFYSYEPNRWKTWEVSLSREGWSIVLASLRAVSDRLKLAERAAAGFKHDRKINPIREVSHPKKAKKAKGYKKKVHKSSVERARCKVAAGKPISNTKKPPVVSCPLKRKGLMLVGGSSRGPIVNVPTKGQKPMSRKMRLRLEHEMNASLKVQRKLEKHMVQAAA